MFDRQTRPSYFRESKTERRRTASLIGFDEQRLVVVVVVAGNDGLLSSSVGDGDRDGGAVGRGRRPVSELQNTRRPRPGIPSSVTDDARKQSE